MGGQCKSRRINVCVAVTATLTICRGEREADNPRGPGMLWARRGEGEGVRGEKENLKKEDVVAWGVKKYGRARRQGRKKWGFESGGSQDMA